MILQSRKPKRKPIVGKKLTQMMVFKYNDASLLVFNMSVVLAFLFSSLNPALYLWRMKEIRNEVKRLVNKMLC